MTDYVSKFDVMNSGGQRDIAYIRDYTLGESVEALARMDVNPYMTALLTGGTALFIGDSYTYGTGASDHNGGAGPDTKRWSSIVCSKLDMTEINVAVGSTGFVDPGSSGQGMPFFSQWNSWYTSASQATRDSVKAVFVAGGYNDVWNDDSTYGTVQVACRTLMNDIAARLPKAAIILIPMMWQGYGFTVKARNLYNTIIRGAQTCTYPQRVTIIRDAFTWTAYTNDIASDGIHPNDNGHLHIAQGVLQGINDPAGASSDTWYTKTYNEWVSTGSNNFIQRSGDMVTMFATAYQFATPIPSGLANRKVVATIPPEVWPEQNQAIPLTWGNQICGSCIVTTSGSVYIVNEYEDAMPQCIVPTMQWPWYGSRGV